MTCGQVDDGISKRLGHLHVPSRLYLIVNSCYMAQRSMGLTLEIGKKILIMQHHCDVHIGHYYECFPLIYI